MPPEMWVRLIVALERIADVLEGMTDETGLLHVLPRTVEEEEEADEPAPSRNGR